MAVPEPKITVSASEYYRELRQFRTLRERRRKLYSEWGRMASLWRWRRRPEDYEKLVAVIRAIWANVREERGARAIFARKIVMPYWRVGVAYMFRERKPKPPYFFYAEFRITVYTRNPERWAVWNPAEMIYDKPSPELESELRELLFIASILAGRRHYEWLRGVVEIPGPTGKIPDFECSPVEEKEVEEPLDYKHFYVRIEEPRKAVEYDNKNRYDLEGGRRVATIRDAGVESWYRDYRKLIAEGYRRGLIRSPERFMTAARQKTLDEWRRFEEE